MTAPRPNLLVDLKLEIARRGKTVGQVADEARVPQIVLKNFLDGRLNVEPAYLTRLELWYDGAPQLPRRPGMLADYANPPPGPTRSLNMASLGREFEAMRKQLESLAGRVEHLEMQLVAALDKDVLA